MQLDIDLWRADVRSWWRQHAGDVRARVWKGSVCGAYGMAVASTFTPLLALVAHAPAANVEAILGSIAGAVGGNLIANMLQRARDGAIGEDEVVRALVTQAATDARLRSEIDRAMAAGLALDASAEVLGESEEASGRDRAADAPAGGTEAGWDEFAAAFLADLAAMGGDSLAAEWTHRIRDVRTRNKAGRDMFSAGTVAHQGNVTNYGYSADDLVKVIDKFSDLLRQPDAQVDGSEPRDSVDVRVGADIASISREAQAAAPVAGSPAAWLTGRMISEAFDQLDRRFVPLAGFEKPRAGLEALVLMGSGPSARIERELVPDVRMALEKYRCFVLTAEPGGGKTTVLGKLALDEFQRAAQAPESGWIPLPVQLRRHKEGTPAAFLTGEWLRQGYVGGVGLSLEAALHTGRLLLLADGLSTTLGAGMGWTPSCWRSSCWSSRAEVRMPRAQPARAG